MILNPIPSTKFFKWLTIFVLIAFIGTVEPFPIVRAEGPTMLTANGFPLPPPGVIVHLSPEFNPTHLRGMVIDKNDPFRIDFFINKGEQVLSDVQKKRQYQSLVKYFLAALATPDEDQWVNLSPYEKNRIIAGDFARTTMGRDLLAEDYMLKQVTASIIYPEGYLGKKFWNKIYEQAQKQFGTTNIPVNTFNKVWIVPDKAVVYEDAKTGAVYIIESKLKVMLEEDYLSLSKHSGIANVLPKQEDAVNKLGSQIVREIVIPELIKEVNKDKNFAPLRQIYSAMILATWYKKALKKSILAKIYTDKGKVKGIDQNPALNRLIYLRYLKAFKKGVYNYIKEETDPFTQEMIPRKYFSGGFSRTETRNAVEPAMIVLHSPAQISPQEQNEFETEGILNQIDRVPVSLAPVLQGLVQQRRMVTPLALMTINNAMSSSRALKNIFGPMVLIGLMMTALFVPKSKAATPEEQQIITAQNQRDGINTAVDSQTLDQGLNDVFKSYIQINGKQIIMPDQTNSVGNQYVIYKNQMPYLSALLANTGIENSDNPYNLLVQTVKARVTDLKNKLRAGTITPTEQNELDHISEEAILLIQKSFVGIPEHAEVPTIPHYRIYQNNVQKLILGINGNHEYNCEAISIATVFMANEMGISDVYLVNIKVNHDGTQFPTPDGFGHVANAFQDSNGHWTHFDQGNYDSKPQKVEIYDVSTGNPIVVAGNEMESVPNARPRSYEDLILDEQAYTLVDGFFSLTQTVDKETLSTQPDKVNQILEQIKQGMPWIDAHPAVINREVYLRQNLANIRSFVEDTASKVIQVKDQKARGDVLSDYNASVARLNLDLQKAVHLFDQQRYSEAKEMYSQVGQEATAERERFERLKDQFPTNIATDDGGVKGALTTEDLLNQLSRIANAASSNALAADHNASIAQGQTIGAGTTVVVQTPSSQTGIEAFQSLTEKINSLNTEAGNEFDKHNYQLAADKYEAVAKLISDNIDKMHDQLSNLQGLTDGHGNFITGSQLIGELLKQAGTAKSNRGTALNNLMIDELNSIVIDFNHFANDSDVSVVKQEVHKIVDKTAEALKTQGDNMSEDVKAKYEEINERARKILNDSAMNIVQPVGGIDFNSANLDLQIKGNNGGISFSFNTSRWDNVKIQGLVPRIIEIKSVSDWGNF